MTRSCPSQRPWRKAETVDGRFLCCPCLPASTPPRSTHRLRLGELPCAVEVRKEGQGADAEELLRAQLAQFALVGAPIAVHGPRLRLIGGPGQRVVQAL